MLSELCIQTLKEAEMNLTRNYSERKLLLKGPSFYALSQPYKEHAEKLILESDKCMYLRNQDL